MGPFYRAATAAMLSLVCTTGLAQTGESVDDGSDDSVEIDTIIVTGTKSNLSITEIPASVAVVTGETIEREPLADLYDIVDRIPNVTSSFGGLGFSIRGVDQRGIGSGSGQTLTIFVDDSPLGNFTTFFGPTGSWDLGSVEVFRGPQSTNFGRNALAGAIYIRTQDPSYEPDLKLRAEAGDFDMWHVAAAGGGTLVEDRVAFRLAGEYRESDGFLTNTLLDAPADATELSNLRGKLLFEPTESLQIVTTSSYTENFAGEDTVPLDDAESREVVYDTPGREGTESFIQSINAIWTISDALEFQSITAFQDTDYVRLEDIDGTALPIGALDREGSDESLAQELRLRYSGERLSGVVGLYFVTAETGFLDTLTIPASALNPSIPSSLIAQRGSETKDDSDNYAFFFDGVYSLSENVDLLFGGRYDDEEQENFQSTTLQFLTPIPPGFDFLADLEGTETVVTKASFDAFLPKLGVRRWLSDRSNVAFVVQRGYRAGGSEINFVDGSVEEFDPEFLWNYELSYRSTHFDGRLRWNANVFFSDWEDQQVGVPISEDIPNLLRTVNAGESELYGFETDVDWFVSDTVNVYGSVGYVKTEFKDFPNPLPLPGRPDNLAGNEFPFAPEWTGNVGVDINHPSGFFGGIDVNYQGSVFSTQDNIPEDKSDSATLVNLRVGYTWGDRYSVTAYARNLFDEFVVVQRGAATNFARLGDPRVVALRFDANW